MSAKSIDRFVERGTSTTDFYQRIKPEIIKKLGITDQTPHWEYPLIIIDNKPARLSDLNQYTHEEIKSYNILSSDAKEISLYGANAAHGLVRVQTLNEVN